MKKMSKKKFREISLSRKNLERLDQVNSIIEEYQADGYVLTLRQLYYQLVSRDIIPNKQNEYNNLSKLLKEGRMAGVVDWDAIEDRLRQAGYIFRKEIDNNMKISYINCKKDEEKVMYSHGRGVDWFSISLLIILLILIFLALAFIDSRLHKIAKSLEAIATRGQPDQ